jgi:putative two-component system response regulator
VADKKKILVVDDDPINRKVLCAMLAGLGHEAVAAESGPAALASLGPDYDLVLSDVVMPAMNGFELTRAVRARADVEDLPVIIVTTLADKRAKLEAVQAGANDFLGKPIDPLELRVRVDSMLRMKEKSDEVKSFQGELQSMVESRTLALREALSKLSTANLDIVRRLSTAAEYKDQETAAHIERMSIYSARLAALAGLPGEEVDLVLHASPMHDVGKIGVPDQILLKPGKLTPDEWEIMKKHTVFGAKILSNSDSTLLRAAELIALTHHEKFDGTGYPAGMSGPAIPLYGRICALADVFDALTSVRPYKPAFEVDKAVSIMREGRGSHFDPDLLDLFLDDLDTIVRIKDGIAD